MADSDGEAVDMAQQRRRRDRQIKSAGFLLDDVEDMARSTDADTISLALLADKGTELNALLQKENYLMKILRHEEDDPDLIAADKAQRTAFFAITTTSVKRWVQ